jgi:hypothetical protein
MPNVSGTDVKYEAGLSTSKFERGFQRMRSTTSGFESDFKKSFGAIGVAGAAAFGAVTAAIVSGTKSLSEFERLNKRTEALIRATGNAAGLTAKELINFSEALDLKTLADRNQIIGAVNAMQTFKSVQGDVFKRSIELSEDLAEVLGVDLRSQTIQLGKALEDPIRGLSALRRVGVTFTESEQDQIKALVEANKQYEAQSKILDAIAGQVGGAGEAAAGGLAGQLDTLSVRWRELKESMAATDLAVKGIMAINDVLETMTNLLQPSKLAKAQELFRTGALSTKEYKAFIDSGPGERQKILEGAQYGGGYAPMAEGGAGFDAFVKQGKEEGGDVDVSKEIQDIIDRENKAKLEMVNEYYKTAEELENEYNESQLEIKKNNYQAETDLYIQNLEARYEASEEYAQREAEKEQRLADLRKYHMNSMVQNAKFAFQEFGKQSGAAFEAYKAIAIAETIIDTYKGAQAAFSSLAGIPIIGPILGAAAAAAAIAAGMARVQAISSQQPGGGTGGGGGGGGAIGTYQASPTTGLPEIDPAYKEESKEQGALYITVEGDFVSDDLWVDKLVDKVNDAADRDVFVNNSRYAGSLA